MNLKVLMRRHLAAVRALLVLTAVTGIAYPLAVLGIAQGAVHDKANGSLVTQDGQVVGSKLIGQPYTDSDGNPDLRYFQGRPSAAGDGYDPTSTGATNLGPEDIVDTFATPDDPDSGSQSLLTQVCTRSKEIGEREGVSGLRPFCTSDGVGAVVAVFPATAFNPGAPQRVVSLNQACPARPFADTYLGVKVTCAEPGEDYSAGRVVPIRHATTDPLSERPHVPADAVSASGSGLDPNISVAYAELQAPRIARERDLTLEEVFALIRAHTTGRTLGFMGEPVVNVLQLNLALDRS